MTRYNNTTGITNKKTIYLEDKLLGQLDNHLKKRGIPDGLFGINFSKYVHDLILKDMYSTSHKE